jgi:hypothetical protein
MAQTSSAGVGASTTEEKLVIIIVMDVTIIWAREGDARATDLVPLATDHPHAH